MNMHARIRPSARCKSLNRQVGRSPTSGTVEIAQVQSMRMIGLPGRHEHRQNRH